MDWLASLDWYSIVLTLIIIVINIISGRGNSRLLQEVKNMQYRLPTYRQNEPAEAQEFSALKPKYELNERTNELVDSGEKIDIQKLINSAVDTCLERTLARLMPTDTDIDDKIVDLSDTRDDLESLTEALTVAEDWRERLDLPDTMSVQDVFKQIEQYEAKLRADIDTVNAKIKEAQAHVEKKTEIE